jgi:hypothetical protein
MADELNDDVFQYEGSEFTQCISGFGRHVIEQVLGDIEDRGNDECTDAEIKDRITYNVGEFVRWLRHFNGKSQKLAAEVAELRKELAEAKGRAVRPMSETPERWPVIFCGENSLRRPFVKVIDGDEEWAYETRRMIHCRPLWWAYHDALATPAATEPADKTCRTCRSFAERTCSHWAENQPSAGHYHNIYEICDKHVEVRK